jgi:long-chain fatty acid transport protein
MIDRHQATFLTRVFAVCLFFSITSATLVYGEAFRNLHQGTAATGQGDAFAAQADDPSALFYNPAGMSQLKGVQLYANTLLIGGQYDYTSPSGQPFTGNLDGTIVVPPPSTFYLTANLDNLDNEAFQDLTLGIGLNSPFGLLIRWPDDVPFSEVDVFGTLPLIDIKPTMSFRLNEYLAIGGGLDIYTFASFLGEGQVEAQAIGTGTTFPPGALVEVNGKDTAIGWNIGALLNLWHIEDQPRLNLAFVYRSQTTLNLTGEFMIGGDKVFDTVFDINLPQVFTWGIAGWPFRDKEREWKVEVDLDYTDWSSFKNLNIREANTGAIISPQPRDWKGSFVVKLGTEYKWLRLSSLPDWIVAVRGGYIRSETPVPEFTYEPLVPDSDFNGFSVGLGLMCKEQALFLGLLKCHNSLTKAIGLDFTYVNQLYESRTISNNRQPVVEGTYQTSLHAGGIGLRVNF